MYNKKLLSKAISELGKAKAPSKPKDIIKDPRGQWAHPGENTRIPGGDITMDNVPYPVWAQPNIGPGMMMQPGQDYNFPGADYVDEFPQMQSGGHTVKQRRGVRENSDGSVSSHLMKAEYVDGRGWVAFPSLFQDSKPYADDQENWNEVSEEDGWWPIYQEAVRRGEVYDFGEDKEAALAFGMGSWKDQLPEHLQDNQEGGFQLELTPEEIDKYVKGGYVVEELPKAQTGLGKILKYANKLNVKRPLNLNTWKKPIVTGSIVDELGIDVSNLVNATRFDINNLHDINQTRPIDFGTDKLLNSVLNDYPLINSDPLYIDKLAKLSSSNPKANFIMPDFGNSLHPELAYAMKHSPNIKTFSDPDLSWTEFVKNQKSYANGEGLLIKNLEGWDPVNQKDVSLTYNVNEGIMSKVDPIYQTGRFRGHPNRGVNQHNHLLGMTGNYPSIIASGDNIFTSSGKKRWGERTAGKLANDWDYPGMPVTQDWVNKLLGQKKSSNWMSGSPRFANMLDQSFQIDTPLQDKVFMKFIHPKRKLGGELPKANKGIISKAFKKTLPFATKFDDIVINSNSFFKTNVLKDPLLQKEMLKRLATGIEPMNNYTGDMLYELRSPEGMKRLLKQESEHLEHIGYPESFIDKQAELNYNARLFELESMGNSNNKAFQANTFLEQNRLPVKSFFQNKFLYSNASYSKPNIIGDLWNGDEFNQKLSNILNTDKDLTQLGQQALPGAITMGVDFNSPFNIPVYAHEIRGHGLQRARQLQIDRDALKVIKPKKELNENQQNAYDYWKKSGKEPSAYLNELREAMLLKGLIKHRYENITPEKLQVASAFFKRNPMGVVKSNNSKSYLSNTRVLDFMEESPEMYQNLSWLLNRLPTLGLGLGAAGAVGATLEEKKLGGELPKANFGKFVKTGSKLLSKYTKPVDTYNKIVTGNSILPYALKLENSIIPKSTDYIKKLYTDNQIELLDKYGAGMQRLSPEDWESLVEFTKSGATDFSKGDFPISRMMGYYDISKKAEENAIKNLKLFETFTFPEEKNIRTWSAGIPTSEFERTGVDTRLVIPSKYTKKLGDHFAGMPYTDKRSSFIWRDKPPQSNYYIDKYGRKIDYLFNKNAIKEKELLGALPNNSFTLIGKTKANGINNLIIKPNFKQGGNLPKAKYGKWMKYLNPPNSITTSRKFLFTSPEKLLRTEAAWKMAAPGYSSDWSKKSVGLRDFTEQLKGKYNFKQTTIELEKANLELRKLLKQKEFGKIGNIDIKIDEIQKIREELDTKRFSFLDDYSKFKLDYSGLPITQARGKYGDALGGGQGKIFNNLLNDKEYIKYGTFFGDNNDMQNLINVGKTYNSSYAEAAFPTEAFTVGDSNWNSGQKFVQFMPKLDYSGGWPLSVDEDVIYNTVKELNELGVGLDYSGVDNIGSVGDKLGLVDLSYIGKPGQRSKAFERNKSVFVPDISHNRLGSGDLVREIREMIVPGSGIKGGFGGARAINKYGGNVGLPKANLGKVAKLIKTVNKNYSKFNLGKDVYKHTPNLTKNILRDINTSTFGTANAIAKTIAPVMINPLTFGLQVEEFGPFTGSPLNFIPSYGKTLPSSENTNPGVAYRKFGDNLDYVKLALLMGDEYVLNSIISPAHGGKFRIGKKQIQGEGNWAEMGHINERYPGTFAASFDTNVPGTNVNITDVGDSRNGILVREGNNFTGTVPYNSIMDPGVKIHRRLPFSNKYVDINMDKLREDKFDPATMGGNLQSLLERYGYVAGIAGSLGLAGINTPQEYLDEYVNNPIKENYIKLKGLFDKPIKKEKDGGNVGVGDEVDKATMERLKAQGYTFEEI